MQIKSPENGMAKVLASNHRRVQFQSMTAAAAALLATGQAFKFAGETSLFFTISSVISVSAPEVELSVDYNGAVPFDTLANYQVWRDRTPNFDLFEFGPGDADIRDGLTENFRIIDSEMGGGGGGGGGFDKFGISSVTADAVTKTVTPPSGSFPSGSYKVWITPNWNTTFFYSGRTTSQFVVTFGTPAPASAEITWGVLA